MSTHVEDRRTAYGFVPNVGERKTIGGELDDWITVRRALGTWGEQEQLMLLAGETGEMLAHVGRYAQGRFDPQKFADEVADALIMIRSASLIAGPGLVAEAVRRKTARLEERLDALAAAQD